MSAVAATRPYASLHAAAKVITCGETQRRSEIVVLQVQARSEVRREVPAAAHLQGRVAVVEVHVLEAAMQLELRHQPTAHAHTQAEAVVAATTIDLQALQRRRRDDVERLVDGTVVTAAEAEDAEVEAAVGFQRID